VLWQAHVVRCFIRPHPLAIHPNQSIPFLLLTKDVMEDSNGNLWIGNNGIGVSFTRIETPKWFYPQCIPRNKTIRR